MKGLVLSGLRAVEFRDDLPDPFIAAPTDAIVEVRLAGICGSDLHPYEGRERVRWGVVPGHEGAGVVAEAGPAVRGFRPGDRVALPFSTSCGGCGPCRRGLSARCVVGELFGWADPDTPRRLDGAQAEFVRVPLADTTLIPLSDARSFAEGVLLGDNFATGFYCASRAEPHPECRPTGVLIGCGAVGLSGLVSALHLYGGPILAVDPEPRRREAAARLGAAATCEPDDADSALAALGCNGADFVLEAVGSSDARALSARLAAPGATVSSVGVPHGEFGVAPAVLYDRNLTWRTGRCPVRSLQAAVEIALTRGLRIPVEELMPGEPLPLSAGPRAYGDFAARTGPGLKPALEP